MTALERIEQEKLIAILRGIPEDKILNLASALHRGGISLIEVTFDPKDAENAETRTAIRRIREAFSGEVCVGAGTVLTVKQVRDAAEAGAEYIISPNVSEAVIRETKRLGLLSVPGALTPTEIQAAHEYGADFVKLFPVSNLGPAYVKAVAAPLSHIRLLAVGGVKPDNIRDFLAAGACGVGAAGNMVNREWMNNGEWDKITASAGEFVNGVKKA